MHLRILIPFGVAALLAACAPADADEAFTIGTDE